MNDKLQPNFNIIRLHGESSPPTAVTKVGILPFVRESGLSMLFMKPSATAKHLGDPSYQIAKGTRRIFINEEWLDMREEDLLHADESFYEPLLATALREGHEEVGLRRSNIKQVFDLGGFTFISASRGLKKPLHMFAAEVFSKDDFDAHESSTGEVRWLTAELFAQAGRPDHVEIMQEIVRRLANMAR